MNGFQSAAPRLILASASPARRGLLEATGLAFEAHAARIDETAVKRSARDNGQTPEAAALLLAQHKARRIERRERDALVIGADQLLVCEDRWYDKPVSVAAARDQLLGLRGRTHTLVTAMVGVQDDEVVWEHIAQPRLTMRAFSEPFLDAYLAREGTALLACVGAYRLEGPGILLFEGIEGDHSAILGLPLLPLLGFLRQRGLLVD